jgi:hypothetical protein
MPVVKNPDELTFKNAVLPSLSANFSYESQRLEVMLLRAWSIHRSLFIGTFAYIITTFSGQVFTLMQASTHLATPFY